MFGSEHIWRTVLSHPSVFATYGLWYQFSLHHFSLATVTAHLSLNMVWYIITNILERSRPWSRFRWTRFPVELEQVAPVCRPLCSVDGPQQARRDSWLEIVQVYSPALLPGINISLHPDSQTSIWWWLTTVARRSRAFGMQRKPLVWSAKANFYFELCRTFLPGTLLAVWYLPQTVGACCTGKKSSPCIESPEGLDLISEASDQPSHSGLPAEQLWTSIPYLTGGDRLLARMCSEPFSHLCTGQSSIFRLQMRIGFSPDIFLIWVVTVNVKWEQTDYDEWCVDNCKKSARLTRPICLLRRLVLVTVSLINMLIFPGLFLLLPKWQQTSRQIQTT